MNDLQDPPVQVPPYIRRVKIHDHAPLRNVKVDFKRGLNIIIGHNGAGKTRFLSLLNDLADLQENKKHFQGAECQLTFGGVFTEQTAVTVEFEGYADTLVEAQNLAWDIVRKELPGVHLTDRYSEYLGEARTVENFLEAYPPMFIAHGTPSSGLPILDESAELVLEKRGTFILMNDRSRRIDELNSRFSQAVVRSIVRLIRNGFTVLNGVPAPPPTPDIVRQWVLKIMGEYTDFLNKILPLYSPVQEVRCNEYFQVYHQETQEQFAIKGLVLEYQLNGEWLSFRMLSDGTKRLVYIISDIFAPDSISLDKRTDEMRIATQKRKTVFLEEPELGIHPAQLTKLLNLIREVSKEHQVIMTTHAPQVLDMLTEKELNRITICELDPKKGTQFRKLSRTKQAQAREYMREVGFLSDYWRYSFLEAAEAE
ncbi:AAA family ATPase [Hymenobacter rubripertinctus]|uniref:ATPase AAA-type core domain-containing protein n=1 Tax=Hymenobacter rubripertinctus TaxID=2029981 RepID=A0A418R623_9BACT|nr:ATP-binding protein [Hymenobacter rubripertinctus]RIY12903.1 hypothetical protein D0T11_04030 [Hymenobacter rubripertinctus]